MNLRSCSFHPVPGRIPHSHPRAEATSAPALSQDAPGEPREADGHRKMRKSLGITVQPLRHVSWPFTLIVACKLMTGILHFVHALSYYLKTKHF